MRTAKVRALDGRWRSWAPSWLASHRPSRLALPQQAETKSHGAPAKQGISRDDLKKRIATAALVFRGYDLTNLGRAPELLRASRLRTGRAGHPRFGVGTLRRRAGEEGRPGRPGRWLASRPRSTPSFTTSARSSAWSWPRSGCSRSFSTSRFPRRGSASAIASASSRPWSSGACTRWSSSCRSRWPWRPTAPS